MEKEILFEVHELRTTFHVQKDRVEAVRGVSFGLHDGEILAIVGESGSGKSVTMKSVLGILPENATITAKKVEFLGKELLMLPEKEKRKIRGKEIAMIFQDPMTALNPLKTIGSHLIEVIRRHSHRGKEEAFNRAVELLTKVGISSPEKRMKQYPHEFSGGMRQRVLIAMALSSNPKLLIADEPTTALDVTIQAQILELLKRLSVEEKMSIILITHDLGVVASLAHRIVVMYGGLVMEQGSTEEIFYQPKHPYTRALLGAIPKPMGGERKRLEAIPGMAPSLKNPEPGCPFAPRCRFAVPKCLGKLPSIHYYNETQSARCYFLGEELDKIEGGEEEHGA